MLIQGDAEAEVVANAVVLGVDAGLDGGEVGGDAAIYVDPMSAASLAVGIRLLLGDEERRRELIAAGYRRVADFSWENAAVATAATYRRVLDAG